MAATTDDAKRALPQPSALQTLFEKPGWTPHPHHLRKLAEQVAHNLEFQHLWTDIQTHTFSLKEPRIPHRLLPRPIISGLPPQRLYIHPDEQIALLQAQKAVGGTGMGDVLPEREWVCPTHLREKWSLRRFGDIFDHITLYPPEFLGEPDENEMATLDEMADSRGVATPDSTSDEGHGDSARSDFNEWRTTKRILLATVDDDSTVVYYIVHDGIVKPRQN